MKPSITVLMPVYNAATYLQEAMDSILQQTYTDFEFLIIDDGSTDASAAIIRSYNDVRIRFIQNEENLGITGTLNKGIDLAAGELIARMDADDISYPERLQKQYDYFKAHPDCALLSTWAREITSQKEVIWTTALNPDFYYYHLAFECWIYHPTVMYKKSAVVNVGKYKERFAEDYDLWCRLSRKYKLYNLPEVLLDYRASESSLSRVSKKTEYEDAHLAQVYRNLQYYAGDAFSIAQHEVEFLRLNFEPVLQPYNRKKLVACFKKLDHISSCIKRKDNVNRNLAAITGAARFKKMNTIRSLKEYLDRKEWILLLIRLSYWDELFAFFKREVVITLKRLKAMFL